MDTQREDKLRKQKSLLQAVQRGNFDKAYKLLVEEGVDSNFKSDSGWTPLHVAAHTGCFELASLLLDYGASPDARSPDNSTALHYATQPGNEYFKIAQELLDNWADPNAKNTDGSTPLHKAVERQSFAVAKLLLESGADSSTSDHCGATPFNFAKAGNMARLLLGDNINYPKPAIMTPLFGISVNGNRHDDAIKPVANTSKTSYLIVQCRFPLDESDKEDLSQEGLEFHDYVCKNTYLCRYLGTNLDRLREIEPIVYVDVYRSQLKLDINLSKLLAASIDRKIEVRIIFHDDIDTSSEILQDRIATASHVHRKKIGFFSHGARLAVNSSRLHEIANIDEVRRIEEDPKIVPMNDHARLILGCDPQPQPDTSQQATYQRHQQAIAVADTGLDLGSASTIHSAFSDRVIAWQTFHGTAVDECGHGTHVCGSVVGNGTYRGNPIMGTAPQATLMVQSLWRPEIETPEETTKAEIVLPDDLEKLFTRPYFSYNVRVHVNAWGPETKDTYHYGYTDGARTIDSWVWNHKDMIICFAAGNRGSYDQNGEVVFGQIGAYPAAKNCITVGACESERPGMSVKYGDVVSGLPVNIASQFTAQHRSRVAPFSSRGPTRRDDNDRALIKPDIVAPGTLILSRNSLGRPSTNPPQWPAPHDDEWCYMSGTSMAVALLAGCAADLREALIDHQHIRSPSASLVKALLVNGAELLSPEPHPDNHSGFGRADLEHSLPIVCGAEGTGMSEAILDNNTLEFTTEVLVKSEHTAFKVTLVWTDPPGNSIMNPLRLALKKVMNRDGVESVDNLLPKFPHNNVQQIFDKNICQGKFIITVRTRRLKVSPQPFSLVWRLFP
ncbi:peptidase S8 and S53 [Xylaria bambusicola]|uniref:peptidase S8 and S53 n=1 Tax=Xylaria bambusicola TaxID=326684 RepID=UPI002008723C|nr:peptidase S8 and S53 [Xylaria bambusicola]KAI0518497.1 peptidase S8 and S53 [Xylaria bambusicola]